MPKALSVRVCKTRMVIDQKKTSVCWCWYRYRSGGRCGERGGGGRGRGEKEAEAEIPAVCRCKSNKGNNWEKKCMLSISLNKEGLSASLAEVAGWPRDASVPRLLIIVCWIDIPHVSHLTAQSAIRNAIDLLPYRYLCSPTR